MQDIITSLEAIADAIAVARQQVSAEMYINPQQLRKLNAIALQLIAAAHSIQHALATARSTIP
jgi:hypothetical protein